MAEETETIKVQVVGEVDDYTRKMTAAANATTRLEGAAANVSTRTGVLGQKTAVAVRELDRAKVAGEGLKRTLQGLGGKLGESGEKVTAFSEGVGKLVSALGPLPVVAGVGVGALLALGGAGLAAAANTSALLEELDKMGRAPVVTKDQREAVLDADRAMKELNLSVKELVVTVGVEFAPVLTQLARGLDSVVDASRYLVENGTTIARVGAAIGSLGASEAFLQLAPEQSGWATLTQYLGVAEGHAGRTKEDIDAILRTINDLEELAPGGQIGPRRTERRASDGAGRAKAEAAAIQALTDTARRLTTVRLEGEAAAVAAYEDTLAAIEQQVALAGSSEAAWEAANAARLAAEEELQAALEEIAAEAAEADAKRREEERKALAQREQDEMRAAEARSEQRRRELAEAIAMVEQERAARIQAGQGVLDNAREVSSGLLTIARGRHAENTQLERAAFAIDKGVAITRNIVYGANAFTAALDDAPVPFNFALAASVAAAAAAQTAVIASQTLHTGTRAASDADEAFWKVTRRETPVVLTPQGRQTVGDLAADTNAERRGGDRPLLLVVGHEVFDRGSARAARNPNSALHAAIRKSEPVGHSRGRR